MEDVLGPDDGAYAAALFGVEAGGNFISADAVSGSSILYLRSGNPKNHGDPARIESVRNRLIARREKRPRPQRDGKILTDWNGLMIAALAKSSRAFGITEYYRAAETAMHFILDRLRLSDGGLLHRSCGGEAAIPAFADDYAFVIRALTELYETSFDPKWLEEALILNQFISRHFSDVNGRGYFTTSDEGETLIARNKEIYDGALPSCNSMMLGNLVLLSHLTGDPLYDEQASLLADGFAGIVRISPSAYSAYLCGLDHLLGPASDIVIAGEGSDPVAGEMIRMIHDTYLPSVTLHFRRSLKVSPALEALAPFTRDMTVQDGKTTVYICSGRTCLAPSTNPVTLREYLGVRK
jgi:uncharacterized protein YyaL (SSP411 family)